jgi:hypothetical protein
MTISSTTRFAGYEGTGTVSTFAFGFKVFAGSDLSVTVINQVTETATELVFGTGFTVTLNANQESNPGGTVTLTSGNLPVSWKIAITSDVPYLQPVTLTNNGGFYPEVINDALDRATIQIQQINFATFRAITSPASDGDGTIMVLPGVDNRANKYLAFDAGGSPVASAGTTQALPTSPTNLSLKANDGGTNAGRNVIFYDNTTETMRILGSGATSKVGIGTANPTARLNVSTTSATDGIALNGNSSRWLRTYINSGSGDYNPITQANDRIIAFGSTNADVDTAGLSIVPWSTSNNGLRMDASGKVGIGTASPTKKLEVSTASNSLEVLAAVRNANAGTGVAALGFNVSDTSEASSTKAGIGLLRSQANGVGNLCFYNNANSGGSGDFASTDERMRIEPGGNLIVGNVNAAGNTSRYVDIYNYATGASALSGIRLITHDAGGTPAPSSIGQILKYQTGGFVFQNTDTNAAAHMAFSVGSTERMRITSAGGVGIGTATPSYTLDVAGTGRFSNASNGSKLFVEGYGNSLGYGIQFLPSNDASTYPCRFYNASGTLVGTIQTTNLATSYVTSSDYRLKTNVVAMTGALDKVDALNPCKYTWIADASDGEGFIAHEIQSVIPHAVTGTKDDVDEHGNILPQGVDYSRVVPTLTAAIKELKAIVEAQAARIAALEARA